MTRTMLRGGRVDAADLAAAPTLRWRMAFAAVMVLVALLADGADRKAGARGPTGDGREAGGGLQTSVIMAPVARATPHVMPEAPDLHVSPAAVR